MPADRTTITERMSQRTFQVAAASYRQEMTKKAAADELVASEGMNGSSAQRLIAVVHAMLDGRVFKSTLSRYQMGHFLDRIKQEFGSERHANALSALAKHVIYWEGLDGKKSQARDFLPNGLQTAISASDLAEPPSRILVTVSRIVRDTVLSKHVKVVHNYNCQICGLSIILPDGSRYAEAHHLRPLGHDHHGPDIEGNIICLCPNHHAACDLGAIYLDSKAIRRHPDHKLDEKFIAYHNTTIQKVMT